MEIAIGSLIGCVTTIIISRFYYKKATKDLLQLKNDIKSELEKLSEIVDFISEDTVTIRDNTTPEDFDPRG